MRLPACVAALTAAQLAGCAHVHPDYDAAFFVLRHGETYRLPPWDVPGCCGPALGAPRHDAYTILTKTPLL
ncbi:MAG: hypothetical protein ACREWI_09870 [Telluria sp.]